MESNEKQDRPKLTLGLLLGAPNNIVGAPNNLSEVTKISFT